MEKMTSNPVHQCLLMSTLPINDVRHKQSFAMILFQNRLFQYLVLLLFFPLSGVGQVYTPFISTLDSSDTWKDIHSCSDFDCFEEWTRRYTLNGDTTIGGMQYTKLQVFEKDERGTAQSQNCQVSIVYRNYYYGAIRESGKQIVINRAGSNEYLAYDFNLSIGDTTPAPDNGIGNETARVINSIDSVLVNGMYRKRYMLASGYEIIEGIGSSSGLFNTTVDFFDCFSMMECYEENGDPHYFTNRCDPILSTSDSTQAIARRKVIKIVDYFGREIDDAPNTLMFYIYSDGSARKVYRAE